MNSIDENGGDKARFVIYEYKGILHNKIKNVEKQFNKLDSVRVRKM